MNQTIKKTIDLGKVDANRRGRKINRVTIEVELSDGELSMVGNVWNRNETNCETCGQCGDTIAALFPDSKKVQRIVAIWKKWHLNHMNAGTPAQSDLLSHAEPGFDAIPYPKDWYRWACEQLKAASLYVDQTAPEIYRGLRTGNMGYVYGSAWLKEELPVEVVEEVMNW